MRISRRENEKGTWPLGHTSLDAHAAGELSLVEQLPKAQATALRLTVLQGLSLRATAAQLQISPMAVQRAQKKPLAALRQQLVGAGRGPLGLLPTRGKSPRPRHLLAP